MIDHADDEELLRLGHTPQCIAPDGNQSTAHFGTYVLAKSAEANPYIFSNTAQVMRYSAASQ
jgi:hypothetical protein